MVPYCSYSDHLLYLVNFLTHLQNVGILFIWVLSLGSKYWIFTFLPCIHRMEGCYQVEFMTFLCLPGQPFQDECRPNKQLGNRRWFAETGHRAQHSPQALDTPFLNLPTVYSFPWRIFFWLHSVACGILVPQPGIKPVLPAVEVWILNHRNAREAPLWRFLHLCFFDSLTAFHSKLGCLCWAPRACLLRLG